MMCHTISEEVGDLKILSKLMTVLRIAPLLGVQDGVVWENLRDDRRRINWRQCPEEIGPETERQGSDNVIGCWLRGPSGIGLLVMQDPVD